MMTTQAQCVQTGKGRNQKTDRRCAHLAIDHFGLSANLASEENRLDFSDFWLQIILVMLIIIR